MRDARRTLTAKAHTMAFAEMLRNGLPILL